jgi:hypothetical protein
MEEKVFHTDSSVWLFNLPLDLFIFTMKLPLHIHVSSYPLVERFHPLTQDTLLHDGTSPTPRSVNWRAARRARHRPPASSLDAAWPPTSKTHSPTTNHHHHHQPRRRPTTDHQTPTSSPTPTNRSRSLDAAWPPPNSLTPPSHRPEAHRRPATSQHKLIAHRLLTRTRFRRYKNPQFPLACLYRGTFEEFWVCW